VVATVPMNNRAPKPASNAVGIANDFMFSPFRLWDRRRERSSVPVFI
jgi:hypothetical protein